MLEEYFDHPQLSQRVRSGPLGPYCESFAELLAGLGYARRTMLSQFRLLDQMGQWLVGKELAAADLDERIIDHFFDKQSRPGTVRKGDRATARRVMDHLRQLGVIPARDPVTDEQPLARLERRYEQYLQMERGLSTDAVRNYRPFIHRFLVERFADAPLRLGELHAADPSAFILRHAPSLGLSRAKLMVTALRSFVRFLLEHGEIDTDLVAAVPPICGWRQASVPKYLGAPEVQRLLDGCNRHTATGRRNYAILLLLARLGLRAGEVVALQLDDLNWRAGEITVRGKGSVQDRLPLLADVGEALADYVQRDRPRCGSRRVFIRMKAPHRGFVSPAAVSTIVARAVERAGLHPPMRGAHLLRHSLATGMLRAGASMAEIGQVLRHRAATTTEIYAKVDFDGLRALAQPWPGEEVKQ